MVTVRSIEGVNSRQVSRILLAATLCAVLIIVFAPGPPALESQQRLAAWLHEVHQTWMPRWITFDLIEFLSNVVMFLPLGLFGALAWAWRRRYLVVAACCALSALVELAQAVVLPERMGSVVDVVANTVGAAVGYGMAEWWLARRSAERAAPTR